MDNSRKKLLWSVILVILYFLLVFYIGGFNVKDKTELITNIITIVLSVIGIVYECVLIFNKKIDLKLVTDKQEILRPILKENGEKSSAYLTFLKGYTNNNTQ